MKRRCVDVLSLHQSFGVSPCEYCTHTLPPFPDPLFPPFTWKKRHAACTATACALATIHRQHVASLRSLYHTQPRVTIMKTSKENSARTARRMQRVYHSHNSATKHKKLRGLSTSSPAAPSIVCVVWGSRREISPRFWRERTDSRPAVSSGLLFFTGWWCKMLFLRAHASQVTIANQLAEQQHRVSFVCYL